MSSPKSATSRLARYFVILCGGYAIDVLCYVLLVNAGVNLYAAYVASFAVGTVGNVLLLRRYFAPGRHALAKDLVMSLASNGSLLVLMLGLYYALMNLLGLPHLAAKVLSNALSFVLNYLTRRLFF